MQGVSGSSPPVPTRKQRQNNCSDAVFHACRRRAAIKTETVGHPHFAKGSRNAPFYFFRNAAKNKMIRALDTPAKAVPAVPIQSTLRAINERINVNTSAINANTAC